MSITFRLFSLPFLLNPLFWEKKYTLLNYLDFELEKKDVSFDGITKRPRIFWSMYLFNVIIVQLLIVPLLTFKKFDLIGGKITGVTKSQIPMIMYHILVSFTLPFGLAAVVKDNILKKTTSQLLVKTTTTLSMLIGFFIAFHIRRTFRIVDILIPYICTYLTLFTTNIKQKIEKYTFNLVGISLPSEKYSFKDVFDNKKNERMWFFLIFLFWFSLNIAVGKILPIYSVLRMKLSVLMGEKRELISSSVAADSALMSLTASSRTDSRDFITFITSFFIYMLLPIYAGKSYSMMLYHTAKTEEDKLRYARFGFSIGFMSMFFLIFIMENIVPQRTQDRLNSSVVRVYSPVATLSNYITARVLDIIKFPMSILLSIFRSRKYRK